MEKKNQTKSAFKKKSCIIRRKSKSRRAIQKLLNNLHEQESEYLNENKQITQCVFLGALCLKPVPTDIFQVTLQPISFTTQSKSGVLYNNTVKNVTNDVGEYGLKGDDTKNVKVKKTPRKNSKTAAIETNVFIGNICEQKTSNRLFELFNNRHLCGTENIHSESSKIKLNGKSKKDNKIKYKIKVGGILSKNKKDLNKQKSEGLSLKDKNNLFHSSQSIKAASEKTCVELPKIKANLRHKFTQPKTSEVKKSKFQIKNNNCNVNNAVSPLFVGKFKSDSKVRKTVLDNAIECLKKKRGIEITNVTKMESKSKTIPSLVSVESLRSEKGTSWKNMNKTQTGHSISIGNSFDGSNKSGQKINIMKEGSMELMEIIDDEIEDYLEIDQNIVADLEALIPEEEIESISNTLIGSTKIPDTIFNNTESKSFTIAEKPLSETQIVQLNENIFVNTSELTIKEDDDDKNNIEITKCSLNDFKIQENILPNNSIEPLMSNQLSEEQTRTSKKKSVGILPMSKKRKVYNELVVNSEEIKQSRKVKSVHQSPPQKLAPKVSKQSKAEPKIEISKKIRKITDFLFPIRTTDDICTKKSYLKNVTQNQKQNKNEVSKNMAVVFLDKTLNSVSSGINKESLNEMRTLRSCNKKSKEEITNIKAIELPKQNNVKESILSPENEVVFICKNDGIVPREQKIKTQNKGFSLHKNDNIHCNENISEFSSAPIETKSISPVSIENPTSVAGIQIRNSRSKIAKNCIIKRKKLIDSKKINEPKIEKVSKKIGAANRLLNDKKNDSELKISKSAELKKKIVNPVNSNEASDKIPKLNVKKVIHKECTQSKLENTYKERGKNEVENYHCPPGKQADHNKSTKLEQTLCNETGHEVEKEIQTVIMKLDNKIESKSNATIMKKHNSIESIKLENSIPKTRSRRETASRIQKIDSTPKEDLELSVLENEEVKINTSHSINLETPLHQNSEETNNIAKIETGGQIINYSVLSTANENIERNCFLDSAKSNELRETNSLVEVEKKSVPCENEDGSMLVHNENSLKLRSFQETELPKAISKTRLQLRKKIVEEQPNENIELNKPTHLDNNTQLIVHENLNRSNFEGNKFVQPNTQNTLSYTHLESGTVDQNICIIANVKENTLKDNNVSRNTRKNKIENNKSITISVQESDGKLNLKKNKQKEDTKQLCELKVTGNKKFAINKPTGLKKKSQLETKNIKIFKTRSNIKGGRVLKRITNLRKKQQSKSMNASAKIDGNKIGISDKKRDKVKPVRTEKQNSEEVQENKNESPILLDSSDNAVETFDSDKTGHKVALMVEDDNKINNNNKKYKFRNRGNNNAERKTILSKIRNVVNNLSKQKIIPNRKLSSSTLLDIDSQIKSHNTYKVEEDKLKMNSTNVIINASDEVTMLEQPQEEHISKGCLNKSETAEKIASSEEENITETQNCTVENVTSNNKIKNVVTKSQNDITTLVRQNKKFEEFSADTSDISLDALSRSKCQINKEITGIIDEDEALNASKYSDIQHEEKIRENILEEFDDKKEIICYNDINNGTEKMSNVQDSSDNTNVSSKHVKRKREHDKPSDSGEHKADNFSLGVLQEKKYVDNPEMCENKFLEENTVQSQMKKTDSKVKSPNNIGLSVASKRKSRKKSSKTLANLAPTKLDEFLNKNKEKLITRKDEKSNMMNATSDMSSEIIQLSDQKILSCPTENVDNVTDRKRNEKMSESQVDAQLIKVSKNLDLLYSSNDFETTAETISQNKLDISSLSSIAPNRLHITNKISSTTLIETLNENQLLEQNQKYDSLSQVSTTRKAGEIENIEKNFVREVFSASSNNENSLEESVKEINNLEQPATKSNVEISISEEYSEPKQRKYRKVGPQDQKKKIRQVTRKRKHNMVDKSNLDPKIEADVLKLSVGDDNKAIENCNIPYVLKEDLTNPSSELSQEIERRMQVDFGREFDNNGPRAPQRYIRVYRCRICLLVCETYRKLKLHRRIHDVATPYQCQQCDKSYDDVEDLAAHLRIHKDGKVANNENEELIEIEENNDEVDERQHEIFDDKPRFEQANLKKKKSCIRDGNLQSTSVKKEKLIHRKKKEEVIQMKIAEIKEKLSNDIKKEVGREQMGIFKKFTRSRVKQFSVKNEPEYSNGQKHRKGKIERNEVANAFSEIEDEDDPYECEDDPDYEIDTKEVQIIQDQRKTHVKSVNNKNMVDSVDTEAANEMAEVEYVAEKQIANTTCDSTNTTPNSNTKGIRGKGRRDKNKKFEVIELKRDNLPPLLLMPVKKKTLLIGEMPYPCKKCDSSFWTSLQLERHQLVHVLKKIPPSNNSAPKKVFKCEVCSKEFKKVCDLERHTRVHTGEKPSVCNICNKRFQQAYNLHKHLLTHTQEKNYECIICQKRFGRSDVLNRHVLTHSIDKPFHCSICLKTFIRSSQLKLHLRKHHCMNTDEADKAVALSTAASSSQEECSTYSSVQDNKEPVPCTSSETAQVCAF